MNMINIFSEKKFGKMTSLTGIPSEQIKSYQTRLREYSRGAS
jgi:hypothetical protein